MAGILPQSVSPDERALSDIAPLAAASGGLRRRAFPEEAFLGDGQAEVEGVGDTAAMADGFTFIALTCSQTPIRMAAAPTKAEGGTDGPMAIQALERLDALQRHCLPNMATDHKRALILRASGKSDKEVARIESVSASTFKNRLAVGSSEIAMGLPDRTRVTDGMRGFWVGWHEKCCLADAVSALRGRAA